MANVLSRNFQTGRITLTYYDYPSPFEYMKRTLGMTDDEAKAVIEIPRGPYLNGFVPGENEEGGE